MDAKKIFFCLLAILARLAVNKSAVTMQALSHNLCVLCG